MKFIAINKEVSLPNHEVISTDEKSFYQMTLTDVDYLIISGGDGLLRRIIQHIIFSGQTKPKIIIDAQGSFNVIAKKHLLPKMPKILKKIEQGEALKIKQQDVYKLNNHIFLFSAGNVFDALHIHLSEILRIGILKKGALKYLISSILILPITFLTTPFVLFSNKRFFVFTPFKLGNFRNFYTNISHLKIDLKNNYNLLEIDGDLIIIQEPFVEIKRIDTVEIVAG